MYSRAIKLFSRERDRVTERQRHWDTRTKRQRDAETEIQRDRESKTETENNSKRRESRTAALKATSKPALEKELQLLSEAIKNLSKLLVTLVLKTTFAIEACQKDQPIKRVHSW